MVAKEFNKLSADKALTDPRHDRMGCAPFASHLADSICKMTPTEGLVMAIYGPWGSGKSTTMNFLIYALKQKAEEEQPIIMQFNPWWFSGHEDLTRRFFSQLQTTLSTSRFVSKELREAVAGFAEIVSGVPIPYVASSAKALERLAKAKQKDVPQLKDKISDALSKQDKKVLVIIDDIDRLTGEEIRQLFRVVKAVADFPNVLYLLAFDKGVVEKALEKQQSVPGEEYLEKIVQVPLELPAPDRASLREVFLEKLRQVIGGFEKELFDRVYWQNILHKGIDHFIGTPRDVVRLTNSLAVTYPSVKGEVNVVDFIALETLRVFEPVAYEIIRNNKESFTGTTDTGLYSTGMAEALETFHNTWMVDIDENDRHSVKNMLEYLFPKLQSLWGNTFINPGWSSEWARKRRICAPEIFPIYFRLSIPEGDISNSEMRAILKLMNNQQSFSAKLLEFAAQRRPDGRSRARSLLERLEDYTEEDISEEQIPTVVGALLDAGDSLLLSTDESQEMFDFGNDFRAARVLFQLLRRLGEPRRFEILKNTIEQGKALSLITSFVIGLGQEHGKFTTNEPNPVDDRLLNLEHTQMLIDVCLSKTREAARNETLLYAPKLATQLAFWKDQAGVEEVRQWVCSTTNDDSKLIRLLEAYLQKTFRRGMADVSARMQYRLDPEWLKSLLEPDDVIDRIRAISVQEELTELQKAAVDQYIREYEMRKAGKDPNDFLAFRNE